MSTSVYIKPSRSLSKRVGKTTAAILAAAAMSVVAIEARAVTITNVTTNTVVFHDDFESGNLSSPSAGTWTIPSDVTVISSTTPPNPGPAEGTFYARSFRDTQFVSGQGNMFANLSAAQTNAGDLIRMSAMLYVPDDGANARAFFALDNGNAGTNGRAIVRSDGAGNVIALVGGLVSQDTGLDYISDTWQWWELEYAVGGSTFNVRVNGVSAGPFTSFTTGPVNTGEIFNGAFDPAGSVFVDAGDSVNIIGNTSATSIDLGSLTSVVGSVNINGNTAATSINVGSLVTAGELTITDNTSATVINAGALVSVSGELNISGNISAGELELPSLVSAGELTISDNTSADAINVGSLTTVGGELTITDNASATVINAGALVTVSGELDISGNVLAGELELPSLVSAGELTISDNTSATAINAGALVTVSGELNISGNISAGELELPSLVSAGELTITDNGPATTVNVAANVTVSGDLTIETTGSGTFDVDGAEVGGNTSLTTTGYTEVDAATAGGETAVTMLNNEATMEVTLPDVAFTSANPVTFSIEKLPGGGVETVDGEMVTHLETYAFDFAIPTLNSAAELNFEIDLVALVEPDRLSLLGLLHQSAELTLGVRGDAPGAELQLFDVCSGGGPVADACVIVQWLDETRMLLDPLGNIDPSILRFEALVGHFSTYSLVALGLAGDYNLDGTVDAADYVVWRKNDGTQPGYDTWRANFGRTTGSGTGATANAAVPEPTALIMFVAALIGCSIANARQCHKLRRR